MAPTHDEWVYAIGSPGSHTIKIGRSNDPQRRLCQIQTMSPVPLQLLWTRGGNHETETYLHHRFAEFRSHGEWFAFTNDPITALEQAWANFQPEPDRKTTQEAIIARRHTLLVELDETSAEFLQTRRDLEDVIRGAREAGVPLTAISKHSGFSREWVRQIAVGRTA